MKIGLAIQQVRSAESDLAEELERVGERHKTDQEVYHLTRTLADISRRNVEELSRFQERYPVTGGTEAGGEGESDSGLFGRLREKGSELADSVSEGSRSGEGGHRSGLLDTVREKGSELVGRRPETGLLLLRDMRKLYMLASEASINWVILGQGAQAAKDHELLQATKECHPDTLRALKWTNTRIKETSPQVLMN
jgi:hypothetical protein